MNWRHLFLSLDGRISRKPFWIGTVILLLLAPAAWLNIHSSWTNGVHEPYGWRLRAAAFTGEIILIWPNFAIPAKRQQDRGQRPWFAWFVSGLLLITAMIELFDRKHSFLDGIDYRIANGVIFAYLALLLWMIVELGCRPGTAGANRYGPDPLA